MESIGYAVAEMHQRGGAGFDVLRVEHRKIAAVFPRAPDDRKQPAIAFGRILSPFDEDRF